MTKKKRKPRKAPRLSQAQLVKPEPLSDELKFKPKDAKTAKVQPELEEEYEHVASDLGRTIIISVVMLVILVVVALILI